MKKLFFILILIKGFWNELLLPFLKIILYILYMKLIREKKLSLKRYYDVLQERFQFRRVENELY